MYRGKTTFYVINVLMFKHTSCSFALNFKALWKIVCCPVFYGPLNIFGLGSFKIQKYFAFVLGRNSPKCISQSELAILELKD